MTLEEKKNELMENLSMLPTAQDRLLYLLENSKKKALLEPGLRGDKFRVEGCLSNLWFVPEYLDGKCYFLTDADSQVVRAIAILLCEFYSGHTPAEIAGFDPSFLAEAGITQHLSPNRRNGLSRLWEKIRAFALAHLQGNG